MKLLLLSVPSILLLAAVDAAPNVIADYRIRNPDITPALGRGYSLTSYDVLSTCLQFDEKTEPTYNYDYQMIETNRDGTHRVQSSEFIRAYQQQTDSRGRHRREPEGFRLVRLHQGAAQCQGEGAQGEHKEVTLHLDKDGDGAVLLEH